MSEREFIQYIEHFKIHFNLLLRRYKRFKEINDLSKSVIESLHRKSPEAICICGDFIYGRPPENERSPLETQPNVLL